MNLRSVLVCAAIVFSAGALMAEEIRPGVYRTPEERFENLPGYDFEPHYMEIDGYRVHYLDEGPRDGHPILLIHGEPTWAYLFRKMVPILTAAGHRCIVPDLIGFGRSDKPASMDVHTYKFHVDAMTKLVVNLDLRDATFFGQDWGGLIGLRVVAENEERFARVVISNTGLPVGSENPPSGAAFMHWKRTNQLMIDRGDIPVGMIVSAGVRDPSVAAAYDAPFPDPKYKAGPLIMPQRVPVYLDDPAREANLKAWEVFQKWEKPFLTAFGDGDPITRGADFPFQTRVPGAKGQAHTTVEGAGHFIQEMKGEELARIINQFIADAGSIRACDADPIILTTGDGIEFVRTPDSCFASLPDWPYEPKYVQIDGLRLAYVDEGPPDGEVVLLLHGQPSWSYLYRKMIPVLVEAGLRVIAMDHMGMGRSDKPIDIAYYSYLGHVDRLERFIQALGLTDMTLFCQDWGSLIGLRVAGMNPDWFARIAVGDGTLPVLPAGVAPYPTVENPNGIDNEVMPPFAPIPPQQPVFYDENCELVIPRGDYFFEWMTYAMKAGTFHASEVVEAMTWFDLPADEEAAYDAPFPSRIYMAGPRVFPSLVNDLPGVTEQAWKGLTSFAKPFVTIWASNDPGNLGQCSTQNNLICNIPGAEGQTHARLPEASHFLQDDQGPEIAARLVDFITNDAPTAAEYKPTCGLPIAADGTGTLCTEDVDCRTLVANTCVKPAGSGNGFCSVQGCTAGSCADPYVCCHDCNPAAVPYLPFEGSACFPLDGIPLTTRVVCTCD